jgi:hypothetical protein
LAKHPVSVPGLYVTGDFRPDKGVEFRRNNGDQGVGFGYNTIYATGDLKDQPLRLQARGKASVELLSPLTVAQGVKGSLNVEGQLTAPNVPSTDAPVMPCGPARSPPLSA